MNEQESRSSGPEAQDPSHHRLQLARALQHGGPALHHFAARLGHLHEACGLRSSSGQHLEAPEQVKSLCKVLESGSHTDKQAALRVLRVLSTNGEPPPAIKHTESSLLPHRPQSRSTVLRHKESGVCGAVRVGFAASRGGTASV
jgi:hypothetical protein